MKEYTICQHTITNTLIAIKEGWSWPGFLFSYAWVAFSRLWEVVSTTLLIGSVMWIHFWLVDSYFNTVTLKYFMAAIIIMLIAVPFILGIYGNQLLKRKYCHVFYLLNNNHYVPKGAMSASSKDGAIALYRTKETEK